MKIDILCSDGSPIGVTTKTIWGDDKQVGVGGAELALLTMAQIWHEAGYKVTVYNSPRESNGSSFKQLPVHEFNPNSKRDFLIIFRSPNPKILTSGPVYGSRIWWSCDQYTQGNYKIFSSFVDKIVCISPYHAEYFKKIYDINKVHVIDLPVRYMDFDGASILPKIKNRMIFTSVPDRGLDVLWEMWPRIKAAIPDATLVITSDYRLWGQDDPLNHHFRVRWVIQDGVHFLGAIPRDKMIAQVRAAQALIYPCIYDELFCISVAEAQSLGTVPVTSTYGALLTTNLGIRLLGEPRDRLFQNRFVDEVVSLMASPDLESRQEQIALESKSRFSPDIIKNIWDKEIFEL